MVNYSEHERQKIAETEYKAYEPNQLVKVKSDAGKDIVVGTVRQVVTDKTGLKTYIVESPDKKIVSVLYRGSEGPGKKGSKADWLDNDLTMAKNIVTGRKEATPQLKSAAKTLNQVLKDYPNTEEESILCCTIS